MKYFIKVSVLLKCTKLYLLLFSLLISIHILNAEDATSDLPPGYLDFTFGTTMDEIKEVIKSHPDFDQVREEILSIRTEPDRKIITVRGSGYIKRAYFHFHDDALFHIYMILNENRTGYYNLLQTLTGKYGNPAKLEPQKAAWFNTQTRITIEKPAIIKYTHLPVWEQLGASDLTDRNFLEKNRKKFLDSF